MESPVSRGSILLEHLIALLILTPALCGALISFKRLTIAENTLERALEREETILALSLYLRDVVNDLDGHRLPVLPRIHNRGIFSFTDSSPYPLPKNFPASLSSDGITGVRLDLPNRFEVSESSLTPAGVYFRGCRIASTSKYSIENVHSFAATSLSGTYEVLPIQSVLIKDGSCIETTLRFAKSMSFEPPPLSLPSPQLLIPVLDHYTLYVDTSMTIRYLSHAGDTTMENQPLFSIAGDLTLQPQFIAPFFELQASYRQPYRDLLSFKVFSRLGRVRGLSLQLNR